MPSGTSMWGVNKWTNVASLGASKMFAWAGSAVRVMDMIVSAWIYDTCAKLKAAGKYYCKRKSIVFYSFTHKNEGKVVATGLSSTFYPFRLDIWAFGPGFLVPKGGFKPQPPDTTWKMVINGRTVYRSRTYTRAGGGYYRRLGFFELAQGDIFTEQRLDWLGEPLAVAIGKSLASNMADRYRTAGYNVIIK